LNHADTSIKHLADYMKEISFEILLRSVYIRLYGTPLARRKIAFLGENLDFWDFMNLIEI
jgi:hypothetical protein